MTLIAIRVYLDIQPTIECIRLELVELNRDGFIRHGVNIAKVKTLEYGMGWKDAII